MCLAYPGPTGRLKVAPLKLYHVGGVPRTGWLIRCEYHCRLEPYFFIFSFFFPVLFLKAY